MHAGYVVIWMSVQFTSFVQKVNFNTFIELIECVYLYFLIYIFLFVIGRDTFRTVANIAGGAIFVKMLKAFSY